MNERIDDNERLKALLKERGYGYCPNCHRELDQGDVAWNNASTEGGTPCATVFCICLKCDTNIFKFHSWYPGIEDFEELVHVLDEDLKQL